MPKPRRRRVNNSELQGTSLGNGARSCTACALEAAALPCQFMSVPANSCVQLSMTTLAAVRRTPGVLLPASHPVSTLPPGADPHPKDHPSRCRPSTCTTGAHASAGSWQGS